MNSLKKYQKKYREEHLEKAREYAREYYKKNREKLLDGKHLYEKTHKEKIKKYRLSEKTKERISRNNSDYYIKNKNRINKNRTIYFHNRLKVDIKFKLRCTLRSRLGKALRGKSSPGSFVKDLGCTIQELKLYIESKFQPGMTWANWSKPGWHIDHIIPLSSFDLSDREQFLRACHYTNLQPLWAVDNLRKNDKILVF